MSTQVKCAGCGFLAVRNLHTRELVEVEEDLRQKWRLVPANINVPGGGEILVYSDFPMCFRRVVDLKAEAQSHDQIKAAITQDRTATCAGYFTKWEQGFTPKEHQEVINAKELRALEATARKSTDLRLAFLAGTFTILGAIISLVGVWLLR